MEWWNTGVLVYERKPKTCAAGLGFVDLNFALLVAATDLPLSFGVRPDRF